MADLPIDRLVLGCASIAEHLGFVALHDVATAMDGQDGRVIGGHMVTLHVLRWGLDMPRATQDADLGVRPVVVRTPELTDRLMALGYSKTAGNRFEKPVPEEVSEWNRSGGLKISRTKRRPRLRPEYGHSSTE